MVVWYAIISKVPSHLLYCHIFQLISKVGDIKCFLQMRRVGHAEVDLPEMQSSKGQSKDGQSILLIPRPELSPDRT